MNLNLVLSMVMLMLPYELKKEEVRINKMLENIKPEIVTLTTYKATESETDSTPLITASGFKITNPKKHKIIAVSRDLKRKWGWGTKVRIVGAGKLSGTYRVHDVMNKRYRKRVDILIGHKDKQTKLKKVKIYKI